MTNSSCGRDGGRGGGASFTVRAFQRATSRRALRPAAAVGDRQRQRHCCRRCHPAALRPGASGHAPLVGRGRPRSTPGAQDRPSTGIASLFPSHAIACGTTEGSRGAPAGQRRCPHPIVDGQYSPIPRHPCPLQEGTWGRSQLRTRPLLTTPLAQAAPSGCAPRWHNTAPPTPRPRPAGGGRPAHHCRVQLAPRGRRCHKPGGDQRSHGHPPVAADRDKRRPRW